MSVLRISPEFRPAYDPLLRMVTALSRIDVDTARSLLTELRRVQPSRPEEHGLCAVFPAHRHEPLRRESSGQARDPFFDR